MKQIRLLLTILCAGCMLVVEAVAAPLKFSGLVTDASGSALVGATIIVEGSTQGATTDNRGRFKLTVPEGTVLQVAYLGYETQLVKARQGDLHITLQEEATHVDEVVVVGYGVQKKVNLTGAVASIGGELSRQYGLDQGESERMEPHAASLGFGAWRYQANELYGLGGLLRA